MIEDKVMYAELRPMLMDKFIPQDDGVGQLFHKDQMRLIIEEVASKKEALRKVGKQDKFPFGLKIIYCAPRSIPREWMQREIQDCIKLKLEFPDLVCGKSASSRHLICCNILISVQALILLVQRTDQTILASTKTNYSPWSKPAKTLTSKFHSCFMPARHS
jgi:hypothetical protein